MSYLKSGALMALAATLPLAACGDVLTLDVESPGRIADEDLNIPDAIPGLVSGMSGDLTRAMDAILQEVAMAGGDLWHGGSYSIGEIKNGELNDDELWDGEFDAMQRARWVAENGIERISTILDEATFARSSSVARAYLMAGFANRLLGEHQCQSTIDGGPAVPNTEHFSRAEQQFSQAITIGQAAGADDFVTAAYGGRASVRAWQGNWAAASQDAENVPIEFSWDAIFSNDIQNDLVFETNGRQEFSVFLSRWDDITDDPRVPWEVVFDNEGEISKGQDGTTDFYRQLKYLSIEDDVPLTHGPEALMIRAEAALRSGDLAGMTGHLNAARASYEMDPMAVPASMADAWEVMRFERRATVWLEARSLWDLARWKAEGGIVADPFAADRETCFPIGETERRGNPNL